MGKPRFAYFWIISTLAAVGTQQVVGQMTNGEDVDEQLPSVIMINQVAILEATHALKALLNNTQEEIEQQCEAKDILMTMSNSLRRSESQQSALLNSSMEAWSALSEVPLTLAAIAQAAESYKPAACDENQGVTSRLDKLINAVEVNSATTANAIQALQNQTQQMLEVLKQTLMIQSENNDRMKTGINKAQSCCNGIQSQMDDLVNVVTNIHKEMNGCREGSSCQMEGSNKAIGRLKHCESNKRNRKTRSPSECHLCCEPEIGEIKPASVPDVIYTESPKPVIVFDVSDVTEMPIETEVVQCCPSGFMIIGSECFYISGELVSWFKARRKCEAMGGYIARPSDTNSLGQYIMNYHENKRWYWIEKSDLDQVSRNDENTVTEMYHNCHVFDAGQEDNQPSLLPSACSGIWYFICQHQVTDECSSLRNL